jgi:hypothetical protein
MPQLDTPILIGIAVLLAPMILLLLKGLVEACEEH